MFNRLSQRLSQAVEKLRGVGRLTENNIQQALKDVRLALLEADVALPAVKQFIEDIKNKAIGQQVLSSIEPGQAFIKLVQDELTELLGKTPTELNLNHEPPVVILLAGLQGSGKTTTAAKLALWLKTQQQKKVMLVSADVYRPAAIEQLKTLAQQIEVDWFPSSTTQAPLDIVNQALQAAKLQYKDVLIVDTAGRLHIDQKLMQEVKSISQAVDPTETLLVVDSMMGQDAVNMAKAFNATIPITGVILTKIDGDARGGAALSMRFVTQKPIKFIGMGEKVEALEIFYPERLASRILGMGDIVSLVEEAERKIDKQQAMKLASKLEKRQGMNFDDFLGQLQQLQRMGGFQSLLSKLPGVNLPENINSMMDANLFKRMESMILSMTKQERQNPELLNNSRKQRISRGSGRPIQEVNRLIKQFNMMQKTLKRYTPSKLMNQMGKLKDMQKHRT